MGIGRLMSGILLDATNRIYGFENIRRAMRQRKPDYHAKAGGSIATGNRWGGPHEHKREIARHTRQHRNV